MQSREGQLDAFQVADRIDRYTVKQMQYRFQYWLRKEQWIANFSTLLTGLYQFRPMTCSSPWTHPKLPIRVRQSPSMDQRTRNKHVLFHRAHNLFSRYLKPLIARWVDVGANSVGRTRHGAKPADTYLVTYTVRPVQVAVLVWSLQEQPLHWLLNSE